jgi:hypothetical protein
VDEYDVGDPLLEDAPEPPSMTPYEREIASRVTTASALLPDDEFNQEPAELGFEPDNKYLSFPILGEEEWPDIPRHQIWKTRFYVVSPRGTVGVVPWAGSSVIWPWERAWGTDLHRAQVETFLKEPEKKEKKR